MPRTKSTTMKAESMKKRASVSTAASASAKKRKNLSTAEVSGQTPNKKANARRDVPLRHQIFEKKNNRSTINNSIVEKLLRRWVAVVPCKGISKSGMHEFKYDLYRKSEDFPSIDRKPARLILNHRYKVILANFVHRLAILASHKKRNTISEKDVYMAMKFDEAASHVAPKCVGFGAMTNHLYDSTDKSFLEKDPKTGDRSKKKHRLQALAAKGEAPAESTPAESKDAEGANDEGKAKAKTSTKASTKGKASKPNAKTAKAKPAKPAKSVTFATTMVEDEDEPETGASDMASLVRKAKSKK